MALLTWHCQFYILIIIYIIIILSYTSKREEDADVEIICYVWEKKKMKGKKRSEVYYRSKKITYVDTEVLCSGEAKLT